MHYNVLCLKYRHYSILYKLWKYVKLLPAIATTQPIINDKIQKVQCTILGIKLQFPIASLSIKTLSTFQLLQ